MAIDVGITNLTGIISGVNSAGFAASLGAPKVLPAFAIKKT